jgi:hypothetical protein
MSQHVDALLKAARQLLEGTDPAPFQEQTLDKIRAQMEGTLAEDLDRIRAALKPFAMPNKVMRVGTIAMYGNGRRASVYLHVHDAPYGLSFTGVIGPYSSGNAAGGCGQIDMEFAHRHKRDNDKRFTQLIQPGDFRFAPGWDRDKWLDYLDAWKRYHMKKDVPAEVVAFLNSLPDTDRQPAWV